MVTKNFDRELEESLKKLVETDYEEIFPKFTVFALQVEPDKIVYVFQIFSDFESRFNIYLNDYQYSTFEKYVKDPQVHNRLKHAENFFSQDYVSVQMPGFPDDDLDNYAGPFQRYLPHKLPFKVEGEEAELTLKVLQMLEKIATSKIVNKKYLHRELPIINGRGVIPIFIPKKSYFKVDLLAVNLDLKDNENYEDLIFEDEILLSKLKQNSYKGNFAIDLIYGSVPLIVKELGPEPFFLNGILIYDYLTECMEPIGCEHSYLEEPEEFLHDFAEDLLTFELLPYEVHIRDKRTLSIVKDLFEKLNVKVIFEDNIPELDAAEDEIFDIERSQQELTQEDVDELGKVLDDIVDMDLPFSKRLVNNFHKFNESLNEKEEIEEEFSNIIDFNDVKSREFKAIINDFGEFRVNAPANINIQDLLFFILDEINYGKVYPEWENDESFNNEKMFEAFDNSRKEPGETIQFSFNTPEDRTITLVIESNSPERAQKIEIEPIE